MLPVLVAAWRLILKRTRADWLLLAAAGLIVLLSTTLLSSGPIYSSAVALSGLHRTLADAPVSEANVEVRARVRPDDFATIDGIVFPELQRLLNPTGGQVVQTGRSDSFALPVQPTDRVTDLAVLGYYSGIENHASLTIGTWPTPEADVVETAISESTASLLNLGVGTELTLTNRREETFTLSVRVVGIYRVNDLTDPFWFEDELELAGVASGESFTTYGPWIVTPQDFFNRATLIASEVTWRVFPIFDELRVPEVSPMRGDINALEQRLNAQVSEPGRFQIETRLGSILAAAERSLLVTRTGVLILTVQLVILAAYALVLTAGLIVDQRRVETALLRSRGASNAQIGVMALMEGLLLAVPAALIGPWLAALSLRLLNVAGPLTTIDLELHPIVTSGAFGLSLLAAIGCVLALVLPAVIAARSFIDARASRGRQGTRGAAQRAGLDIALLVLAGVAFWQLRRYGAPLTENVRGRLGIDPLLVAAPAIGLLAGGVAALRIIPMLAKLIDRAATRSSGLIGSMAAWQVARRPQRYGRSALLLMLALAIGLYAIAYTDTWSDSQQDQAAYQTGSDLRIQPDRRVSRAFPTWALSSAYTQIPNVTGALPVTRDTMIISRSAGTGQMLGLDTTNAADLVSFRSDLAEQSLASLLEPLTASRAVAPALRLPDDTQRLTLNAALTLEPSDPANVGEVNTSITPAITVVLRDGRGMIYRVRLGAVADGASERFELDLASASIDGALATPQAPLHLLAIETQIIVPQIESRVGTLRIDQIQTSPSLTDDTWVPLDLGATDGNAWIYTVSAARNLSLAPELSGTQDDGITLDLRSGAINNQLLIPVTYVARLDPAALQITSTPISAVVSQRFLTLTETAVGDTVQVDLVGGRRPLLITGVVNAFPTLDPNGQAFVLLDIGTWMTLQYEIAQRADSADEWWLKTLPDTSSDVATVLEEAPFSSWRIADRERRADTLLTDPVALGIIGALTLGFISASLFAAIGFVVSSTVSARERITEFSLLRALGMTPRQLTGWLAMENGMLLALSIVAGTALGLGLAWLVLPIVTLTQQAGAVVPGVIVRIPWINVVFLVGGTLVVLTLVVIGTTIALRRIGLGSILRMGED